VIQIVPNDGIECGLNGLDRSLVGCKTEVVTIPAFLQVNDNGKHVLIIDDPNKIPKIDLIHAETEFHNLQMQLIDRVGFKIGFPFGYPLEEKPFDIADNILFREVAFQLLQLTPKSVRNENILHHTFTA
jgi:hypothetical protein